MGNNYGVLKAAEINGLNVSKNYIGNANASFNTAGWATYKDAAQATPVDGTGGSPTLTFALTSTLPLRGDSSFLITTTAANLQGEGASFDFSIDLADRAKILQIAFDYNIASGTYVTGDMTVYIYDVTNAVVIQPAGYQIQALGSTLGNRLIATFQTASNSSSYRLILHRAVSTSSAMTMLIDNVQVGPQIVQYGAPVTSLGAAIVTASTTTNATTSAKKRRVGDVNEYYVETVFSGANTQGSYTLTLDVSIDTAKLISTSSGADVLGIATFYDASGGGSGRLIGTVRYTSATTVAVDVNDDAAASDFYLQPVNTNTNVPVTVASGDKIMCKFSVPVAGFDSTVQMSNDTDTRVCTARYAFSTTQSIPDNTNTVAGPDTKTYDTHGAVSGTGTGWRFTAPIPGFYRVNAKITWANTTNLSGFLLFLTKNGGGTPYARLYNGIATDNDGRMDGSTSIQLNAGDYIQVVVFQDDTAGAARNIFGDANLNTSYVEIERLTGPSAIAATETVACRITKNNGQTITSGNSSDIANYVTTDFDTHGAFNLTTGLYTVPVSGKYRITGSFGTNSTAWTTASNRYAALVLTGTKSGVQVGFSAVSASVTNYIVLNGSCTFNLIAGNTLGFQISNQTGTSFVLSSVANENWIAIERVGN